MSIKATIREIEIDLECEKCQSNEVVTLDYDGQDLADAFAEMVSEGWVFMQDARWAIKGEKPKTIWHDLFGFCSQECFDEWTKDRDIQDKANFMPAELDSFIAEFDNDECFIER